jgi:uncharacterized repeat protein (TIGR02543 family)
MRDTSLNLTSIKPTGRNGDTIYFDYSGAAPGKTLSSVVLDNGGAVKYYGKVLENIYGNGRASVTVPGDLAATDTIQIFVEEINGDYFTDFAGAFTELEIPPYMRILGIPVTDDNKDNITGAGITGGVSFDVATKTLTLNNATIDPSSFFDEASIALYGDETADALTIKLIGQNRLGALSGDGTAETHYNIKYGVHCNPTLIVTGAGDLTVNGLHQGLSTRGELQIELGGTLRVSEYGEPYDELDPSCSLKAREEIIIKSGTLNLASATSHCMRSNKKVDGIIAEGIIIKGGNITVNSLNLLDDGRLAFSPAPVFDPGFNHKVYAGESEAEATLIGTPADATFTGNNYVRIVSVYDITYHLGGGSPAPTQASVNHGGDITAPAAMTKAGYTFGGWYTDAGLTTAAVFPITGVEKAVTLYAKWTRQSTGGSGATYYAKRTENE